MKKMEEVKQIKKKFLDEFADSFKTVGNNLAAGIGWDDLTGEYIIIALLTNKKLKNTLPEIYKDVKVKVRVTGVIKPLAK